MLGQEVLSPAGEMTENEVCMSLPQLPGLHPGTSELGLHIALLEVRHLRLLWRTGRRDKRGTSLVLCVGNRAWRRQEPGRVSLHRTQCSIG